MTLQLQGLFLFSLVWSIAGTITGDSRKKFDVFFRTLISGTDAEHPKPKTIKLTKVSLSVVCACVQACFMHDYMNVCFLIKQSSYYAISYLIEQCVS